MNGLAWLRFIEEEHFVAVPNLQVALPFELSSIVTNSGMLSVTH